jgi:hypothetical protein
MSSVSAAEDRGETILGIPGVDGYAGNTRCELDQRLVERGECSLLLGEPQLEIVELLEHGPSSSRPIERRELRDETHRVGHELSVLL